MKIIIIYGLLIFGLISLANASSKEDIDNCLITSQIFEECIRNEEFKTCEAKGIALAYALKQIGVNENTIKNMVKMCVYYCKLPEAWDKNLFIEKCHNIK